ncbi:MAG: hypothetical protein ACD_52C00324G0006 [uncultured bacterium]|uniref:Uncharacterized protein n=1 Tax=Candidatus Woesebacteria bacterium RIFCSPHIGHO2_12_FULL_41_24 TaxID=1802510 RepID=A0A1F8AUY7_9BACT|nr:MAG: hypothetical protein ACD_52C00324G0006 [uncultured bacterium]OGM14631.1 MAG: hypothetical protein A2W15_01560 [Candidatus Woesebacteria bacterium RBG_16_41_13]OGM30818.1 MAG: hypothetical protein A2873_04145 [Candidatus Woesebacteria bacterium RIFCSPHIGHO2_01_FULL_42_80]OGM34273.1 MAG: hypothetical protein A3D84_00060 [Candidatus Woesebacteria bacterium RIFCSPHIGHO2_02_FULL_42_20]OGM55068.1 MAG: hypothetical protein A3E44_04070 [Candidatus Woesebacteria bacterium RIFCSPHIGHO2_12_FULL_41
MRKVLPGFLLSALLFATSWSSVFSSGLVLINKEGQVIVNVLGVSSEEKLKIVSINAGGSNVYSGNAQVSLTLSGQGVLVDITSDEGSKSLNASDWEEEIVEVEERGDVKKISIQKENDGFLISQGSVNAKTNFPIVIDSMRGELSVVTGTGSRHILRYPQEVTETLRNAKIVSVYDDVNILEGDKGELLYEVQGEKVVRVLGLFDVRGGVSVDVSASTGEVLKVDEPLWLKILGLIFG